MAVDAMRAMLDELMGKERNVPLSERTNSNIKFTDPEVCKHELSAMCPNQLFKNTRSDLGPCGYEIHDDHLEWESIKGQWDQLSEREKDRYPYERDLVAYLDQLIKDMDRKIVKAKERAEAESKPRPPRPDEQKRLDEMEARWKEALDRAATMGETGDVDASLALTRQAEQLKKQFDTMHRQFTAPDRLMSVCEICGVFINSTDNEQRRLDHLMGKQYLGWKKIRETYAELVKKPQHRFPSAKPEFREPERDRRAPRDERPERRDDRYERRDDRYERRGSDYRDRERSPGRRRDYRDDRDRDFRDYRRDNDDRDYRGSRGRRDYDRY